MIPALVLGVAMQTFAHLSLQDAERAALAHAPDVAAASAKVDEARALFHAAKASYGPALFANYAASPQAGNIPGTTVQQRLTTLGAQVTLGDLLAYAPAAAQANAALSAAQFDLANARRAERIVAIGDYYSALAAHARLGARASALAAAQADERAARLRFGAGDAPKLDVVRAEVAFAQAQAALALARADAQNADDALAAELGIDPAQLVTIPARGDEVLASLPDAPTAVRVALASRPELASARANVVAEERAVEVAQRGSVPLVSVTVGETSGYDTGIPVRGPSLGAQMTLPLGGAAHDRVLAERARLAQARALYEKARRAIVSEVGSAARTTAAQRAALDAAERALREARAEVDATQIGYRSGASSSLDVESARATYVQTLVTEITARYGFAQAAATLQLEIGDVHA